MFVNWGHELSETHNNFSIPGVAVVSQWECVHPVLWEVPSQRATSSIPHGAAGDQAGQGPGVSSIAELCLFW